MSLVRFGRGRADPMRHEAPPHARALSSALARSRALATLSGAACSMHRAYALRRVDDRIKVAEGFANTHEDDVAQPLRSLSLSSAAGERFAGSQP